MGLVDSGYHGHDNGQSPIAIVGMACRLPGNVNSTTSLWRLLKEGRSGRCDIPSSRFNINGFYQSQGSDAPGGVNTRGGYFLGEDIRSFDNGFFGILNAEATFMDPQQRMLLEVVFECFETAGVTLDKVSGSDTGCYVGSFSYDYLIMQMKDPEYLNRYSATGMGSTILSNRISHTFNMLGPSLVIDTACSSSLYCLHLACSALKNKDCGAAIVAGANLIQSIEQHMGMMKAGVLSPTSTCHTFSDAADGYGRAEGVGAIYLKRLDDAIRDNNPIRAVIRGTAVGSNGRTSGITAPSISAQEALIYQAYRKAGLHPYETSYVECHGTGTHVGDAVEVEALSRVFNGRTGFPLYIGSIKPNVGHSEAVSGIASIIKVTLALENGAIPPTIGITNVNPNLKLKDRNIAIVTEPTAWSSCEGLNSTTASLHSQVYGIQKIYRSSQQTRAGVNSFGYGGANGHAILESADLWKESNNSRPIGSISHCSTYRKRTYILPFSAASTRGLITRVSGLLGFDPKCWDISDLAYTLGCCRTHFAERGYIIAHSDTLSSDLTVDRLQVYSDVKPNVPPQMYGFIFTGQGAQWPGMGKELFAEFRAFRECIQEIDAVLQKLPDPPTWALKDFLSKPADTDLIHHAIYAQPVTTAIQVAVVELLRTWGVYPKTVVGHSSGEIAAAFAAGYITSAEAITVAYYRGLLNGLNKINGAMMAVGLSREEAADEIRLAGYSDAIQIACINSPISVTMSGDEAAVTALLSNFQARNIFARKLKTGGKAYHSHHMAALGPELERLLSLSIPQLPASDNRCQRAEFISSVTGELKSANFNARYWRRNMESPVLFSQAIESLALRGKLFLIEIGPHATLELPLKQIQDKLGGVETRMPYGTALLRDRDGAECIMNLVGRLFLYGNAVSFGRVNSSDRKVLPRVLTDLPPYPWHYENQLWSEPRASYELRNRQHPHHELLGSLVPGGDGVNMSWRNVLLLEHVNWLESHQLEGTVVFPAAAYISMAIEAVSQVTGNSYSDCEICFHLRDFNILSALVIAKVGIEIFTTIRRKVISSTGKSKGWWEFEIISFQFESSITHATGSIIVQPHKGQFRAIQLVNMPEFKLSSPEIWYERLAEAGLNFGPDFRSIKEVYTRSGPQSRCTRLSVPFINKHRKGTRHGPLYLVHPITIDSLLQGCIIANAAGSPDDVQGMVPICIKSAIFRGANKYEDKNSWTVHSIAHLEGSGIMESCAELRNSKGQIYGELKNVQMANYMPAAQDVLPKRQPMLRVSWKPDLYYGFWSNEHLSKYLGGAIGMRSLTNFPLTEKKMICMHILSLLAHKSSHVRVLELLDSNSEVHQPALNETEIFESSLYSYDYTTGYFPDSGELYITKTGKSQASRSRSRSLASSNIQLYDAVIISTPIPNNLCRKIFPRLNTLLADNCFIIAATSSNQSYSFDDYGFSDRNAYIDSEDERLIIARRVSDRRLDGLGEGSKIIIVEQNDAGALNEVLASNLLMLFGTSTLRLKLKDISKDTVPPGATIFSTLEVEEPFLSTLTDVEADKLKIVTDYALNIVWVTCGGLLKQPIPDFALVSGLARTIMIEQPSSSFYTIDMETTDIASLTSAHNCIAVLSQPSNIVKDYEFIQHNGLLHVSRFVPDDHINQVFRQDITEEVLVEAKPYRLILGDPRGSHGIPPEIHFKDEEHLDERLVEPGLVKVDIKSIGLNREDFNNVHGNYRTITGPGIFEYCGIVTQTGLDVISVSPGDRVVVMAPGQFKTCEIVPEKACVRLRHDEQFSVVSTLPYVYSTALYALKSRAQAQPGESVLIHWGASSIGVAAIQIAKMIGLQVFTTANGLDQENVLVNTYSIERAHIFSSKDDSFLREIMACTEGRGVDIVLNFLSGDLLHDSWRACAPFGRFIELGLRDIAENGKLDMDIFKRNVTFTAVNLIDLFHDTHPASQMLWQKQVPSKLLSEVIDLYRIGLISVPQPVQIFDISETSKAIQNVLSEDTMGKTIVSLEDTNSLLNLRPPKFKSTFDPQKIYLLVGCLGGLGRSITKWMVKRGARKFVFMNRSGIDRAKAKELIGELTSIGASARVIRGNVSELRDVERAVAEIDGKLGGVVQAAMGLSEALFSQMSADSWHTGIDPKVKGTWNLHHAIQDVDFFLMIGSVSGSVGVAAQSNYCAANHFLDVFARYRRSLGLPAVTVGLGMIKEVGYLHDNPDIGAILSRTGISVLDEDEMLRVIDIALSSSSPKNHHAYAFDEITKSYILTGLESSSYEALRANGFDGPFLAMQDPRANALAAAFGEVHDKTAQHNNNDGSPLEVAEAIEGGMSLREAVSLHLAKRFSTILCIDVEKLDLHKPLMQFGIDSMIATEVRTWLFHTYKSDVPFFDLLSQGTTINTLVEIVLGKMGSTQV